jgi:hypothetical protein
MVTSNKNGKLIVNSEETKKIKNYDDEESRSSCGLINDDVKRDD